MFQKEEKVLKLLVTNYNLVFYNKDKEVKRLKELMDRLETMYLDLTLAYLDVEEKNQKVQEKMKNLEKEKSILERERDYLKKHQISELQLVYRCLIEIREINLEDLGLVDQNNDLLFLDFRFCEIVKSKIPIKLPNLYLY